MPKMATPPLALPPIEQPGCTKHVPVPPLGPQVFAPAVPRQPPDEHSRLLMQLAPSALSGLQVPSQKVPSVQLADAQDWPSVARAVQI